MKKTKVCQYVRGTVVYARMSKCTQSVQCVTKTTKNQRYLLQQMSFSVGVTIREMKGVYRKSGAVIYQLTGPRCSSCSCMIIQ